LTGPEQSFQQWRSTEEKPWFYCSASKQVANGSFAMTRIFDPMCYGSTCTLVFSHVLFVWHFVLFGESIASGPLLARKLF
jgi:hypothetical protein